MHVDPFSLKRFPRLHPLRLAFTAWARGMEVWCGLLFKGSALPLRPFAEPLPEAPRAEWSDTQVTPEQARTLIHALRLTEGVPGCVVEIGSWRGVTTSNLAAETNAPVVAIDPFIGPSAEQHMRVFEQRTRCFPNVSLVRKAAGSAFANWRWGRIRFAFIDGSHDYANVAHDLRAIQPLMEPGGMIALHDTDHPEFPGSRRAVYEQRRSLELVAHIPDLVVFRVPGASAMERRQHAA